MGDMGEYYNDLRKASQDKRAHNREQSPKMLGERGIAFRALNGGAHLVVEHNGRTVDFWPGTGRWKVRGGTGGRGVRSLINRLTGVKP